jgi:alpha-beta hydrolase superfamily lysophospholipase
MLEMLNPSAGDVLRFAGTVLKVRTELNRLMKTDPQAAQARAAEIFCAPPVAAKRKPDVQRLRDDAQRFFGWSKAQWAQFEVSAKELQASAQLSSITHEGHAVQCYHWPAKPSHGRKSAGRIVLCHGWEGYGYNFALLITHLRDAGWEVHTFDHLAHGASGGSLSGLPRVLQTLQAVTEQVQSKFGEIDALVGHSLGGAAAGWAVASGSLPVKRLVLMAPFYDTYKLSTLWAKAHLLGEEVRGALQKGLEASSERRFEDFMPPQLAPQMAAQHQLKTLILHDKADSITSYRHSAEMAAHASNVRLHTAEGLGHIGLLADKACVEQVMNFLKI